MKKDLYELLDTLTPEELDSLPEEAFQTEDPDDITLQHISEAVAEKTGFNLTGTSTGRSDSAIPSGDTVIRKCNTAKPLWRILAAAACIALLLCAGVGTYA